MILYHNYMGTKWHQIDRPPMSEAELMVVCKNFPGAVIRRKSTGKAIHLCEIKLKNWHWYE